MCNPDNEWLEFWDGSPADEWGSGCVTKLASYYNEEALLDAVEEEGATLTLESVVYTCLTCYPTDATGADVLTSMFGSCVVPDACDPAIDNCAACATTEGPL